MRWQAGWCRQMMVAAAREHEAAGYLQVVASRTTRIRLAQFRTGSHLDLDLDLVTYCAVNWLTIAQARRQTEMHSGRQRAEV